MGKSFANKEEMFPHQHQHRPLRLAVFVLLQCRVGDFFALVATVCSSWVSINVGTSRRSLLYPEGADLPYISRANCMMSRTVRGWNCIARGWSSKNNFCYIYLLSQCLDPRKTVENLFPGNPRWIYIYIYIWIYLPCSESWSTHCWIYGINQYQHTKAWHKVTKPIWYIYIYI